MRLIPIDDLEERISEDWRTLARTAFDAVKGKTGTERSRAINDHSEVWSELKPELDKLSSGKCWYCESRQVRSDKAVDHFRPKNRVAGSPSGEGYWWLAFDWRNYRYSCGYCNSRRVFPETAGGKGDNFPLFDENTRGKPQAAAEDLDAQERVKLLDPTNPDDVLLLTFDVSDGSAQPVLKKDDDEIGHERALASIELYHLKEEKLQKARFRHMREVRRRLRVAEKLKLSKAPEYRAEVIWLWNATRPEAEYSMAARAMLNNLRSQSRLAAQILDRL